IKTVDDINYEPEDIEISHEYHGLNPIDEEDTLDLGHPIYQCLHCQALMWLDECLEKSRRSSNPIFSLCCMEGKVELPFLKLPP
ncbi:hypothetical protein S245_030733, partial [Arachis hypogaea]